MQKQYKTFIKTNIYAIKYKKQPSKCLSEAVER